MTSITYKKPAALDRDVHRNLRVNTLSGYKHLSTLNSMSLAVAEFGVASTEYPIVFVMNENNVGVPLALTGLRAGENLFVGVDGKWNGEYVPASGRCYPFALQPKPEGTGFIVVIDEEYPGFGTTEGDRLFSDDGKPSPMLEQTMTFLEHFYENEKPTNDFVALLKRLDLLVSRVLDIKGPEGKSFGLQSFYLIDETRLNTLDDQTVLSLAKSGALANIFAAANSLNNLPKLTRRIEAALVQELAA
jgi:hypothetical protein